MEPYRVIRRPQFIYKVSDEQLNCLFTSNVKAGRDTIDVNSAGNLIIRQDDGKLLVKQVIGPPDPLNPSGTSTESQIDQFKRNLCELGINYRETAVIQLFNATASAGTPGSTRIILAALYCNNICLLSKYSGEPAAGEVISNFYEVPLCDIDRAIRVIQNINTTYPDSDLCINRFNVNRLCNCKN
jgi:hypothetical protein